jgi:hypothetical protein
LRKGRAGVPRHVAEGNRSRQAYVGMFFSQETLNLLFLNMFNMQIIIHVKQIIAFGGFRAFVCND